MFNPIQKALLACLIFLNLSSMTTAAGLASSGRDIALKWCASCHVVAENQATASADVPTFAYLAQKHGDELGILGSFLADSHPVMPNMSLTRQEIQDLLAYFGSLD
ncbi:MAG: cytochrome c [Fimbriimonadaceae bacterium]|nr:cytochrome c [Alphaproteobacteria bacterium]